MLIELLVIKINTWKYWTVRKRMSIAQSAGAVEYTDCTSAEG